MSKSVMKHRGFIEEWGTPIAKPQAKVDIKLEAKPEVKVEQKVEPKVEGKVEVKVEPKLEAKVEVKGETKGFSAGSIILSMENDLRLESSNGYQLSFNTGMVEGSVISVNEAGDNISFLEEGSYRFELYGDGVVFSDVGLALVYESPKFTDEMKPFTQCKLNKNEMKIILNGVPTILPLLKGQSVTVKIVPSVAETLVISAGTRLLIHRVA